MTHDKAHLKESKSMEKNFAESAEAFYQAGHSLVKLLLDITTPDFEALRKANHERMKNTISHDIAHCNNESCPAKDRCRRFQAHLFALAKGLQYCNYLALTQETKESVLRNASCIHFWERNEYTNVQSDRPYTPRQIKDVP